MNLAEQFGNTVEQIENFNPKLFTGVSKEELEQAEHILNVILPNDFKEFYEKYNGQNENAEPLFGTFYLCSLKNILEYWQALKNNEDEFLQTESFAERGVRNVWGCSKWIPFASTADGHYLCMDFDPTSDGTVGQIITFWYDSPERELVATSFREFILHYIQNIQDGVYIYQQETFDNFVFGGIVRADGNPMFGTD